MNKRGISDVITTILFVLLALVAVLIVGAVVRNQLTGTSSQINVQKACLDLSLEPVSCIYNATSATTYDVTARYKRGNQKVDLTLSKINLILAFADGTTKATSATNVPGVLETQKYVVGNLSAAPTKLSVAGILTTEGAQESVCLESNQITCEAAA